MVAAKCQWHLYVLDCYVKGAVREWRFNFRNSWVARSIFNGMCTYREERVRAKQGYQTWGNHTAIIRSGWEFPVYSGTTLVHIVVNGNVCRAEDQWLSHYLYRDAISCVARTYRVNIIAQGILTTGVIVQSLFQADVNRTTVSIRANDTNSWGRSIVIEEINRNTIISNSRPLVCWNTCFVRWAGCGDTDRSEIR